MIAARFIERWSRYRIRLTASSTLLTRRMFFRLNKAKKLQVKACSFFCFLSISQLTAYPMMFNEPTNKVETTIFFYHLAIFHLLSNMILHMKQFLGLILCKTLGEELLKLCALCNRKLFWHDTIAPSSKEYSMALLLSLGETLCGLTDW